MKKWGPLFLMLLAGILIGSSLRLGRRNPEKRQERMVKLFSQKLDLSGEQREQLVKILDDKRQKMEALRDGTGDEIRAILHPDQIEKFNQLEARREARHKRRHGPRP